jgi:hypothetical protein
MRDLVVLNLYKVSMWYSPSENTLCLNSMAAHLTTLGAEVKETQIMEKMLRSLPQRFKQITIAIKTLSMCE